MDSRYPSDALLSPSSRGWFAFKGGVGEGSGARRAVTDEWGCVWDSLTDDHLGADVAAYVNRLYRAFGEKGGGYIGYGQVGTDVPVANAEAMLTAFWQLRYPPQG